MTNNMNKEDIKNLFTGIMVKDVMSSNILTVYEGWSIRKLSQFFLKHNISGAAVIASDSELVGVVTHSDVIKFEAKKTDENEIAKVVEHYCGPLNRELEQKEISRLQDKAIDYMTAHSIMTPKVITTKSTDSLLSAYQLIIEHDIHRLFVVENGVLTGVITAMDILRSFK